MSEAGKPLVYLHGLPGGPGELALVGCETAHIHAPDRRTTRLATPEGLADDIALRFPHEKIILIGFSLGALAAFRLVAHVPERIAHLHLIAPAGPLETGDYLDRMAGGALFRLARRSPVLFHALTRVQALLARIAPGVLARQVFASAQGKDAAFAADPNFRARWATMIRACLTDGAPGYRAEILGYVTPWASLLPRIDIPVTLWSGSADNWVPPDMVDALETALPNVVAHHRFDGLSHYSTLAAAMAHVTTGPR